MEVWVCVGRHVCFMAVGEVSDIELGTYSLIWLETLKAIEIGEWTADNESVSSSPSFTIPRKDCGIISSLATMAVGSTTRRRKASEVSESSGED